MKNILFIYDFDDTLFPSFNYSNERQYNNQKWKLLDEKIYLLLYNSLLIGKVIILSDGMINWINSILNNLPKTNKLINDNIYIITTNDLILKYKYKHYIFYKYEKLRNLLSNKFKYIINIGDGCHEYIASALLYKNFNFKITHIKMLKKPDFYQLYEELNILNKNINNILSYNNKELFFKLSFNNTYSI